MAAENIGFTSYPPAYLSEKARRKHLLIGANFASASSGYYDSTAKLYVLSLSLSLDFVTFDNTKLVIASLALIWTLPVKLLINNVQLGVVVGVAHDFVDRAAEVLQGVPEQDHKDCTEVQSKRHRDNIRWTLPHQCRKQRLCPELLHQPSSLQSLHA